jgi:hypothetical protein
VADHVAATAQHQPHLVLGVVNGPHGVALAVCHGVLVPFGCIPIAALLAPKHLSSMPPGTELWAMIPLPSSLLFACVDDVRVQLPLRGPTDPSHGRWQLGARMVAVFAEGIRPLVDDSSCDLIASIDGRAEGTVDECSSCEAFTPRAPADVGCEPCSARAKVSWRPH